MNETVKEMIRGRMEQAFQKFLWKNEDYLKSRDEYHVLFGILKEKLSGSGDDEEFLKKFDELVGAYTEKYEEAVYMMGFYDGMEMGAEHMKYKDMEPGREGMDLFTEQDMVHLIFLYDAFRDLCTVLLETVVAPDWKEGVLGALSRVLSVIEAHVPEEKKGEENPEFDRILHDRGKSPEERVWELWEGKVRGKVRL